MSLIQRQNSSSSDESSKNTNYQLSHEKRQSFLIFQDVNFNLWRKKEEKYLGKHLIIHNFSQDSLENWETASFSSPGEYDFSCKIASDWVPANFKLSKRGISLKNRIIRPTVSLHLKSIGFECRVQVRLTGESSVYVISRNNGKILATSPIIRITRDTSLKGLFVMFGCVNLKSNKFEYKRQVQVPEDLNLQPTEKNFKDIEVCMNDNGDSRISLTIKSCGPYRPIQEFSTSCDYFLPYFSKSRILVAGCGDKVYMNTFSLQQVERCSEKYMRRPDCCCAVS